MYQTINVSAVFVTVSKNYLRRFAASMTVLNIRLGFINSFVMLCKNIFWCGKIKIAIWNE